MELSEYSNLPEFDPIVDYRLRLLRTQAKIRNLKYGPWAPTRDRQIEELQLVERTLKDKIEKARKADSLAKAESTSVEIST